MPACLVYKENLHEASDAATLKLLALHVRVCLWLKVGSRSRSAALEVGARRSYFSRSRSHSTVLFSTLIPTRLLHLGSLVNDRSIDDEKNENK